MFQSPRWCASREKDKTLSVPEELSALRYRPISTKQAVPVERESVIRSVMFQSPHCNEMRDRDEKLIWPGSKAPFIIDRLNPNFHC
jgi:hypothetical protein